MAALSMFDQGFYDRLGFGTGGYLLRHRVDPASLNVPVEYRPPVRLTAEDADEMYALLRRRLRTHGAVTLTADSLRFGLEATENLFSLGLRDVAGRLSGFVAGSGRGENGPYKAVWLAYENTRVLLELLRVLAELGDQVLTIELDEPPEIQLQDLVRTPMRLRDQTSGSAQPVTTVANAHHQWRLLDVPGAVGRRRLGGTAAEMNLTVTDPVEGLTAGDYHLRLGELCEARRGHLPGLPLLEAGIGAFSRMWLGVRPASSLTLTDDLRAPVELIEQLDRVLRIPQPVPAWEF